MVMFGALKIAFDASPPSTFPKLVMLLLPPDNFPIFFEFEYSSLLVLSFASFKVEHHRFARSQNQQFERGKSHAIT